MTGSRRERTGQDVRKETKDRTEIGKRQKEQIIEQRRQTEMNRGSEQRRTVEETDVVIVRKEEADRDSRDRRP